MYMAPTWWPMLSTTNKCKLEQLQNHILLSLLGSPWFVRNYVIYTGLHIPTLTDFFCSLAVTLYFMDSTSSYVHIHDLCMEESPPPIQAKSPCTILDDPPYATTLLSNSFPAFYSYPFFPLSVFPWKVVLSVLFLSK